MLWQRPGAPLPAGVAHEALLLRLLTQTRLADDADARAGLGVKLDVANGRLRAGQNVGWLDIDLQLAMDPDPDTRASQ